jgi:TolB-like protein
MKGRRNPLPRLAVVLVLALPLALPGGCGTTDTYFEPAMDFGSLQSVAVLPFQDLTRMQGAAERVRNTFMVKLLATNALYVLPPGEVARGTSRVGTFQLQGPSAEQVRQVGSILKVDAVITGVLREYGTVRSGTTAANLISLSLQMMETSTGRIIWSASSTKGGITIWDRLLGTGGKPMNEVTEKVVDDLLDQLFE